MTGLASAPAEAETRDQFIPVRKTDIIKALVGHASMGDAEAQKFQQLCRLLGSIFHYEYFDRLEKLRDDYFYFNPDLPVDPGLTPEALERAHDELVDTLVTVLKGANFTEISRAEIDRSHEERHFLKVEIDAPLDDYREVRLFERGHRRETMEVRKWWGLSRRKIETTVYENVVLMVMIKLRSEMKSKRQLNRIIKNRLRPGAILIKYFRNIARPDLNMLFPEVRVVMSSFDKLFLGLPALVGGVPIVLNLYATVTVLFLVLGFYLGISGAVQEDQLKTALGALSGLVALGGFIARQWVKYQRQSLKYQKELTDNVYYRNINNNAGIFDYIIGAAEQQECKEAFLAYHFLHTADEPLTQPELDRRIETWLKERFGIDIDFEVDDALQKLDRLGVLKRDGERLSVPTIDDALLRLDQVWDRYFQYAPAAE